MSDAAINDRARELVGIFIDQIGLRAPTGEYVGISEMFTPRAKNYLVSLIAAALQRERDEAIAEWQDRAINAEIRSRVLAEALEDLMAEQNGPPVMMWRKVEWETALNKARAALEAKS
jgi:hypothetical protein